MGKSMSSVSRQRGGQTSSEPEPPVHHVGETPRLVAESLDRPMLVPLSEVPEELEEVRLRLVYRPEHDEFVYMAEIPPRPVQNVWLTWLRERIDYGEPW